jgi:hypothetical protein
LFIRSVAEGSAVSFGCNTPLGLPLHFNDRKPLSRDIQRKGPAVQMLHLGSPRPRYISQLP